MAVFNRALEFSQLGNGMKKLTAGLVFVGFLCCATVCSAAYLIYLKDGREITAHEYWEEGDRIKVRQYGGVVGFSKDDVRSIEETDNVRTIVIKSSPKKKPKDDAEAAKSPRENKGQKKKERSFEVVSENQPEKPKTDKVPESQNPLLNEFDGLKNRFGTVGTMSEAEIRRFDKDSASLRDKMLKADIGGAYADHLSYIAFMRGKVKEFLKNRGD